MNLLYNRFIVSAFIYFDYHGTRPTAMADHQEDFHYVVEVSKRDSDGHLRNQEELLKAAKLLIHISVDEPTAEGFISAAPPEEISQHFFDQLTTALVRPVSAPGGVYTVIQ